VREGAEPTIDLTSEKVDGVICLHHVRQVFSTSYPRDEGKKTTIDKKRVVIALLAGYRDLFFLILAALGVKLEFVGSYFDRIEIVEDLTLL